MKLRRSQQLIADSEVDMIGISNARTQELIDRGALPLKIQRPRPRPGDAVVLAPLDEGCLDGFHRRDLQRSANARGMAPCFFAIAGMPQHGRTT